VEHKLVLVDVVDSLWASAHRGKWGQLTPWKKMDEKLKNENMQKNSSFLNILRAIRAGR